MTRPSPEEIAAMPPEVQALVRASIAQQDRALAAVGQDEPGVVFANEVGLAPADFVARVFLGEPVFLRGVMQQIHENVASLAGSHEEVGSLGALTDALDEVDACPEARFDALRATLFMQFVQAAGLFYRLGRETERMEAGR